MWIVQTLIMVAIGITMLWPLAFTTGPLLGMKLLTVYAYCLIALAIQLFVLIKVWS